MLWGLFMEDYYMRNYFQRIMKLFVFNAGFNPSYINLCETTHMNYISILYQTIYSCLYCKG